MFYISILHKSTSMLYNSLLSYTINFEVLQLSTILQNRLNVLHLSTILYNLLRRFTALYSLIQATSTFYNSVLHKSTSMLYNSLLSYKITATSYISLLSCTIIFDVSQLSTTLYNQLRLFTILQFLIQSTSMFYNSLLSNTINFEVLHHSSFLFHQLRRFTTLSFLKQSTSMCYNSLLSYKTTLTFYISLLSCTTIFGGLQLSILWYKQLRRFTTLSYINQLRCYTTLYYLKQSTSTFSNSPLSYILNFDILQLSTLSYNHLRRFTTIYYFIQSTPMFYKSLLPYTINFEVFNSLVSDTINFEVLQLSTILQNHLNVS